jgi:hypothetical protein
VGMIEYDWSVSQGGWGGGEKERMIEYDWLVLKGKRSVLKEG